MASNEINFKRSALATPPAAAESAAVTRVKTQVWLNVGYESDPHPVTGEVKFVSLTLGIPLDGLVPAEVKSKNEDFRAFTIARNDLQEQCQEIGATLESGEGRILKGLSVQIRRIEDAAAAAAKPLTEANPYAKKLAL